MALSTQDVSDVLAQWQEWTADSGYELSVTVKSGGLKAEMDSTRDALGASLSVERYVEVQIRRGETLVVDERYPCDGDGLKASVTILARAVAGRRG